MKGTVSIQARVDIISLAQVVQYFDKLNYRPQTKSDVIWKAVEVIKNSAIRQSMCEPNLSVEDAVALLQKMGLGLVTNDRARRSVANALQADVMKDDFSLEKEPVDNLYTSYIEAVAMAKKMGREYPSFNEFKKRLEDIQRKGGMQGELNKE